MTTQADKNTSALVHLSTFAQYVFPFGNYLFPIIIWSFKKDRSEFVDYNGKQVLNFQLSILLYSLLLALIAVPCILYCIFNNVSLDVFQNGNFELTDLPSQNVITLFIIVGAVFSVFAIMKIAEFFLTIYGAVKTSNGERFKYPFSIAFLR